MNLKYAASASLVLMALLNFASLSGVGIPAWLSGVFGWAALACLMRVLPLRMFTQFFALTGVGLGCLAWAVVQGAAVSLPTLLQQNNTLLVMLYSVSFLRLVAAPGQAEEALPTGAWAFLKTLLGVHLLGGVINLSMLVLAASRYQTAGLLRRDTVPMLGQAFAAASFWSPFFAAMGVALTYAPGASLWAVIANGAVLAVLALLVSVLLVATGQQGLMGFPGYPMHLRSLLIPSVLAVAVLLLHTLLPNIAVLSLVSILSVLLTLLVVILRSGWLGGLAYRAHVQDAGVRMVRELALFLGAAVLTVGLQALLQQVGGIPFLDRFDAATATGLLAMAVLLSMMGVHPLISIAMVGPLLQPLHPPMEVVATLFLCMWALGVVASPFSGTNVMLRGQFGLSGRDLFYWNLPYVLLVGLVCAGLFWVWL